ncbi:hypothetical protein F5887DRAFT_923220 [Amanita rubescens]|nr:hypothetical protein F5887DRAFT_923220 [Amanita rubescens]
MSTMPDADPNTVVPTIPGDDGNGTRPLEDILSWRSIEEYFSRSMTVYHADQVYDIIHRASHDMLVRSENPAYADIWRKFYELEEKYNVLLQETASTDQLSLSYRLNPERRSISDMASELESKYDALVSEVKSLRKSSHKKKPLVHPYSRSTVMDRLKNTLKSAPLSKIRYINGQRGINGLKRLVACVMYWFILTVAQRK